MAAGRTFTRKRLLFTVPFGVLLAVAFGAGCQGFFVQPTLTSLTINPATPSVPLNSTTTLSAYAINSNNQGMTLTSGVSWSSSSPSVAALTGACATQTCGTATIQGLQLGTSTITASSESVTNTTTLTVYIAISSMSVQPTSQSISAPGGTTPLPFVVTAQPGSVNISSAVTITAYQNGTQSSNVDCTYDSTDPNGGNGGAGIYCTDTDSGTTGTYTLVFSYTGTTITANAQVTVN